MSRHQLHARLRGIADSDFAGLQAEQRADLKMAAAEIEGHNEAFAAVVEQKRDLERQLRDLRRNHEHTLDFLARWRLLMVALGAERPDDIRIKRALAGEHPMRPAPWEKR